MKEKIKNIFTLALNGFFGGWLVAAVVLSCVALLGKLGNTGSDHYGFWSIAIIGLGLFYGSPSGLILIFVARCILLKAATGDCIVISRKCGIIAIVVGCLGAFWGPGVAALFCCVSFFVAVVLWAAFLLERSQK